VGLELDGRVFAGDGVYRVVQGGDVRVAT